MEGKRPRIPSLNVQVYLTCTNESHDYIGNTTESTLTLMQLY